MMYGEALKSSKQCISQCSLNLYPLINSPVDIDVKSPLNSNKCLTGMKVYIGVQKFSNRSRLPLRY